MNNRYSRQTLFPEIGEDGQKKLSSSTVLLIGCGALGASHAETLARAGVGIFKFAETKFVFRK
jgi:molybdopterin/thiamine biosynthesis adenylyltransferase